MCQVVGLARQTEKITGLEKPTWMIAIPVAVLRQGCLSAREWHVYKTRKKNNSSENSNFKRCMYGHLIDLMIIYVLIFDLNQRCDQKACLPQKLDMRVKQQQDSFQSYSLRF